MRVFVTIMPGGHENVVRVFGKKESLKNYLDSLRKRRQIPPLTKEEFKEILESGDLGTDTDMIYYELEVE